jgi:homoserine O-acetyltransferase
MVAAEVAFTDALGIERYVLAIGPSMGGMRALEWAISHPDRVDAICTIGSSAAATADQIGVASIQLQVISSDPSFHGGDYYDQLEGPTEGMGIARRIAHLTYRSEVEMDLRFGRELQGDGTGRYSVVSYLDHQAEKLARRFDANTYLRLTEAMNSHDVGRGRGGIARALGGITVPVMVVSIDTDRLFPPRLQQELAELTPTAQLPRVLGSPYGHDGFLVEVEAVGALVRDALKLGEHARS